MQNKKFIFSLTLWAVLSGCLFGGIEARAAGEWCCVDDATEQIKCNVIDKDGTCGAGTLIEQTCASFPECPQAAPPSGGSNTTTEFTNPITSNSIDEVLTSLLKALSGLVVTLSIVFIVIGGILYMVSSGDPGMIKRAKDCWLYSVIGLSIVVAAPTFLKQVQEILGGTLTGGGIENALTVQQIATNVLNFLLSIVGIIAIISLVIAGGMYMTDYSGGKQTETAKTMAKWSIIGIIIALGSLTILQQVEKLITG
ncbi:MAG TPA: hypothetical protein DCS28_03595 [Candidatus Moranbacteria bacterium]|nr:hypothetical protein [Candidatus Moranbacteria bacterium]HAT75096.1 hypothetical protein [Candidatus Moranbacteria bacterium]